MTLTCLLFPTLMVWWDERASPTSSLSVTDNSNAQPLCKLGCAQLASQLTAEVDLDDAYVRLAYY